MKSSRLAHEQPIAERLRAFREMFLLSQELLATTIDFNRSTLASYEENRAPVSWRYVVALNDLFYLNPHWLATGEGLRVGGPHLAKLNLPAKRNASFLSMYSQHREAMLPPRGVRVDPIVLRGAVVRLVELLSQLGLATPAQRREVASRPWFGESLVELAKRIAAALSLAVESDDLPAEFIDTARMLVSAASGADMRKAERKKAAHLPLTSIHTGYSMDAVKGQDQWKALRLRLARVLKKLGTRQTLIDYFGVSKQTVSHWLNERREPDANTTLHLLRWVEHHEQH